MSLKHAILGFLHHAPLSGYDLKKAFDTSVRHFWPADQSQIYRTLAQLVDQEWAEVETISQDDRPNRKVYYITETGREELHRWLITPLPPQEFREPLLIQIFFAGQLADEEILNIFIREAEQLRTQLDYLHQILPENTDINKDQKLHHENFFQMLTLEYGIMMIQASLEWIEQVIQRLQQKELSSS